VDPRYSTTDIVQAIGRVLRSSPGKKLGHIFVPLVINSRGEINNESFKGIWRVIKAMESHDTRLTDEIAIISRGIGKGGRANPLSRVKFESVTPLSTNVLDKIQETVTREALSTFEVNLGNLIGFIQKYNREPLRGESFEGRSPEAWRNKQRTAFNAGLLPSARVHAIQTAFEEAFGPEYWSWSPQLSRDLEMVEHLRDFIEDSLRDRYTPFVRVNRGEGLSVCRHGKDVGRWVGSKKVGHKNGTLDSSLRNALENVIGFTMDDANEAVFYWARDRYVEYVAEHGYPPHEDYETGTFGTSAKHGFRLGNLIGGWRGTYRRKTMPAWKVKALKEVDFAWSAPRGNFRKTAIGTEEQWMGRLQEVRDYMSKNSDKFPPYSKRDLKSGKTKTVTEGVWLTRQRRRFDNLTPDQQKLLRELPGWIEP
jgi:hypothetical protein